MRRKRVMGCARGKGPESQGDGEKNNAVAGRCKNRELCKVIYLHLESPRIGTGANRQVPRRHGSSIPAPHAEARHAVPRRLLGLGELAAAAASQ